MKLQSTDKSIETGIIDASDNIRLLVVLFVFAMIVTSGGTFLTVPAVAFSALSVWALLALFTHFVLDWRRLAGEGKALLAAALVIVGDLFCTFMLVYGTGGASSGFQALFVLDIILSALLFAGLELALITGLAIAFYSLVAILTGTGASHFWAASASAASYVVCAWLAHLIAQVIRREKAANERIIRHLNEAVMLLDNDGRVLVANPQVAATCGLPCAEIVGRLATELHRRVGCPVLSWLLEDTVHKDALQDPQMREAQFGKDEETVVYRSTTVPCPDQSGRQLGYVIVCQDITELCAHPQSSDAEASMPYEMASSVANLRAVSEALYGLADSISSPRQAELGAVIRQQTDTLRSMVAELLEVKIVERDDFSLQLRPLEVATLLTTARRLSLIRARARGVDIEAEENEGTTLIRADEEKLWQVLAWGCNRVIDCAIPGRVVSLSTVAHGANVVFTASTPTSEDHADLAEESDAADKADGLTMFDCKRVVELHGGEMTYGMGNHGVEFSVSLPLSGPQHSADAQAEAKSLLAVDPGRTSRDRIGRAVHSLNNLLATMGGHAALAANGNDTVQTHKALLAINACIHQAQGAIEELEAEATVRTREGGRGAILLGLEAAIQQIESGSQREVPVVVRDYPTGALSVSITPEEATRLFDCLLRYCLIPKESDLGIEIAVRIGPSCFANDTEGFYITVVPTVMSQCLAEDVSTGLSSPACWFDCSLPRMLQQATHVLSTHGGRIRPLGIGDTIYGFQIYLPTVTAGRNSSSDSPKAIELNSAGWQGMRVLIAEDEKPLAGIYRQYLEIGGCDVSVAEDGDAAVNILKDMDFDLVITDIIMAGTCGDAIVKMVQASLSPCPVIVVTGQFGSALEEACIAEGAYAVLHKPFPLSELASLVSEALDTRRAMLNGRPVMDM